MKKNRFKILTVACVVGANLMFSSCVDNLLNQTPGGELASSLYWKTESDAEPRKILDRKSTRLNSSHASKSRMPSSA